jgi:hypothetical protein
VVIAPFNAFYVPRDGEPTGAGENGFTCGAPARYAVSAVYTLSQVSTDYLNSGGQQTNQFSGEASPSALAFSSN